MQNPWNPSTSIIGYSDPAQLKRAGFYGFHVFKDGAELWIQQEPSYPGAGSLVRKLRGFVVEARLPETTLILCEGKRLLEVVSHPLAREHFSVDDTIIEAVSDDEANLTAFRVQEAYPNRRRVSW